MAALFASLLVVGFFLVVITKERVNEIGVLKAIGLPNSKIIRIIFGRINFHGVIAVVVAFFITLVADCVGAIALIESGSNDAPQAVESCLAVSTRPNPQPTPESNSTVQLPRWIFKSMQRV